jgi:HlyD family secretion protein
MHCHAPSRRLLICLGLLATFSFAGSGRTQGVGDAPGRPPSRRDSGFSPARRDVFDLLRGVATPAERKELLEQGPRGAFGGYEIQKAAKGDVQLNLSEKGDLEPAEKVDVVCKVRCNERGKLVATTIQSLVDNGATVKKGELLGQLDDATLRERLVEQQLLVMEKTAAIAQASQDIEAGKADAERQIRAVEFDAKIADAALKTHATTEELEKRKAAIKVEQAKLTIELVKSKGGSAEEVKLAESNLQLAELDAKRVESDLALARLREEARAQLARDFVAQAKLKIAHTLAQLQAKREACQAALKAEQTKLEDLRLDAENCKLLAPCDGIVLYHDPGARRGTAQNVIAAGEPVREGQKLLSVWKPGQMLVRVKVDESLVGRLQPGQRAMITIPSVKQSLAAKVEKIASMASPVDIGISSDIRSYAVTIVITEKSDMLRPTMPAQVSILLDEQKNVLRVPLYAVTHRDGAAYCFVKKDDGVHERKVTTGVTGSSFVEIKTGVEAGEEVVVSIPRTLPAVFPGGTSPGGFGGINRPADR